MSKIKIQVLLCSFMLHSCISEYSFKEVSGSGALVVEGFVSNVSYNDFEEIPTDSRCFEIKLTWTGNDINARDQPITNAEVTIIDDINEKWDYAEVDDGIYSLNYQDFKIRPDRSYKLFITLEDGRSYESDFEGMISAPIINGEFSWEMDDKYIYNYLLGNETIELLEGMNLYLNFPSAEDNFYFKWDFKTTNIFHAFLIESRNDINYECWITDEIYFNDVVTGVINGDVLKHRLLFLHTEEYEIHHGFSILVRQQESSYGYYNYWQGIIDQLDQSNLFASPPYNLESNFHAVGHDGLVYGYFGVVQEHFYRWYFDPSMVVYDYSKPTENDYCPNSDSPEISPIPPPSCFNCMDYGLPDRRSVTNEQSVWWKD